jgi:L-fucose dehydrogenase
MNLQLKDKVVLVTGGARGFGAAIVRACAYENAIPVIVDRDAEAGAKLREQLREAGSACELISIDLSTPETCSQTIDQIVKTFGHIDALVNHASVKHNIRIEHDTPDQFMASLDRNISHYYDMAHYAWPLLKISLGSIVNISSDGASASKGAILALTREWAAELSRYGIRVNAIVSELQGVLLEEVASMALFLISANAAHITGQHLFLNNGHVPRVSGTESSIR